MRLHFVNDLLQCDIALNGACEFTPDQRERTRGPRRYIALTLRPQRRSMRTTDTIEKQMPTDIGRGSAAAAAAEYVRHGELRVKAA